MSARRAGDDPSGAPPARSPRRTCVGCRAVRHPDDLVRVVLGPSGTLLVGRSLPGRGAWVCPDGRCVALAARRRAFDRALRGTAAPGEVDGLAARLAADVTTDDTAATPDGGHAGRPFDGRPPDVRR